MEKINLNAVIIPFQSGVTFLYPLKGFLTFSGGIEM